MPTLDNYMIGEPHQQIVGDSSTNTHHRTQADIIGSDPQCLGEGPGRDYHTRKTHPIDRTGQLVFKQR